MRPASAARAEDRLGVVAFDDEVRTVLALDSHGAIAADRVRAIEAGGSTNLSGGWLKACEMLTEHGRSDAIRRIVLLTDGHANHGIVDPGRLCQLASAARVQGVTTTTIGFDDGFEEVLLAGMADAGAGNDYWCAGADQVAAVFGAEFEGLASVVAQNISVELSAAAGCGLAVLNEFPIVATPSGLQVELGDAYGGERRRVIAAITHDGAPKTGMRQVAEIVVRWTSVIGEVELHKVSLPVQIGVGTADDADVAPDPDVIAEVNVLRAATARRQAHRHLTEGDIAAAQQELARTVELLQAAAASPAQVQQAQRDLLELEDGHLSAASTKRMYSSMRATTKGRPTRFDDER